MDSREQRKRFLKTLPIWDDDAGRVKAHIDQLAFDTQMHVERIQASVASFDALPRIEDSSKPRKKIGPKQYNDEDIVKLYRETHPGTIEVIDSKKSKEQERDKAIVSSVKKTSIELLSSKPQAGELVYVMVDENESWVKSKIRSVFHKAVDKRPVTIFAVTTLEKSRSLSVGKYSVARAQDHGENLRVPKRVIAGPSETQMKSGIIGQEPSEGNRHRYMVLLDDGTCSYFKPHQVFPIFYQSEVPWRDMHKLGISDEFLDAELNYFFKSYPRRILMQTRVGQELELSKNGVIVPAIVIGKDCDTIRIVYKNQKEESIFMGCPRLIKTADIASRLTKGDISFDKLHDKLAGNIKRYHEAGSSAIGDEFLKFIENFNRNLKICGSNTARKSTGRREAEPKMRVCFDDSEVFDDRYTCPYLHDLVKGTQQTHSKCTPECLIQPGMKTEENINDIIEEFRDTCDLKVPLKLGWKRFLVKVLSKTGRSTNKQFVYEAPCGRICKLMADIKRYIHQTGSKLDVDYFTLDKEIMLNRNVGERVAFFFDKNIASDIKTGRPVENKFISAINPVCEEVLPIDFEYRGDTFPHPMLKAKGFSFNHEFKSGCDCEDDCSSRSTCACHRLIEEAAGTNAFNRGNVDNKCHYKYKRLMDQVSTGIFECNQFCKCSSKCPNRVVQNGIRVRLQVRKTIDKGWGVFTLDDIPKGSFICTYSAELLDDADQYGNCDMYYADLDYITIVENQKLGLDDDEGVEVSDEEEVEDCFLVSGNPTKSKKRPFVQEDSEGSSEGEVSSTPPPDDEYMPRMDRYPKRTIKRRGKEKASGRRTPQFRKIHSILRNPDKTSQDYTLDARLAGNIGRFFNHSCDASMYPQNIFISTHDLRLPEIAFFTKRALKADDELTWHYAYTVGSIPGREIICKCGAPNCQGRLL